MKISICIPMYNETSTVESTAAALACEMEPFCARTGDTYQIIFADDGSVDGTIMHVPTAESLGCRYGEIIPMKHETNTGKGATVRRAALAADGDVIMYTDCDLAYGTSPITQGIEIMRRGDVQMLVGSRAIHPEGYNGYTPLRRFASKMYLKMLALFAGFKMSDSQCGLKFFTKDLAHKIFSLAETNGWAFDFELFLLAKRESAKISELPVCIVNHRLSRISVFRDSPKMLAEICRIKKRVSALDK